MKTKVLVLLALTFYSIYLISASSNYSCQESWTCDDWSSCHNGDKERDCWDENHCGTTFDKPSERRNCNYNYRERCRLREHCDSNHCYYESDCTDYLDYYNYEDNYISISDQEYQDLLEYYNSQEYKSLQQKQQEQQTQPTYQIINVQYPENNKEKTNIQPPNTEFNSWFIGAIILGALALIMLIIILVVALRR